MGIILGANQYGKAEIRVVTIDRDTPRHEIHDLSVTTTLRGDFAAAHESGDQANVLPTDSQKNTVFAFAKERGVDQIEDFALGLARHFVATVPAVTSARVVIDAYAWDRVGSDGTGHDHAFVRRGQDVRTTAVTVGVTDHGPGAWVVSGIKDLVILKSAGLAVPRLLQGPLHDAGRDRRPDPGHQPGGAVALRRARRRLG